MRAEYVDSLVVYEQSFLFSPSLMSDEMIVVVRRKHIQSRRAGTITIRLRLSTSVLRRSLLHFKAHRSAIYSPSACLSALTANALKASLLNIRSFSEEFSLFHID